MPATCVLLHCRSFSCPASVSCAYVVRARPFRDVARALESFEQTGDARRGQVDLLGQIDAAQRALRRPRQAEQHLVVVDRQTVLGDQLLRELPHDERVRTQEGCEDVEIGFGTCLGGHCLTAQV